MRFAFCVVLLLAGACRSTAPYRAPVAADEAAAYDVLEAEGRAGIPDADEALWRCELGTAALAAGREEEAFRALHGASRIMGTLESTSRENARAILGAESTKTWKGDPHERCMNALYKGLLYWRKGDLDNASACFKRGLLADAWSEAGEHQQDFAVLSFLLGWVSHLRGKSGQASFSFREAAEINPDNPYFADPRPDECNVLIVADIGLGPVKFADGPGQSIARFATRPTPDKGIVVAVDGVPLGRSEPGVDVIYQATTRGDKKIDGIRRGKAVFKTGTAVAGVIVLDEGLRNRNKGQIWTGVGLLLMSALTNAQADTRHWSLLPASVHVLPLRIEPGRHSLEVHALGANGAPLPGWSRTFEIDVPAGKTQLYYFRTGRRRQIFGLTGGPG